MSKESNLDLKKKQINVKTTEKVYAKKSVKSNVKTDEEAMIENTKLLGLSGIKKTFKKEIAVSETKFYRNSLRSGQKVEFEGSIVVLGDVNFGAEVIAGENVVVLGILRGLAHAGAKGNKEAIICARDIQSKQIRISNIVKECENDGFEDKIIVNNAYLDENDEVILE